MFDPQTPVVAPTVNLNGTDGKVLLDQYMEAHQKFTALIEHMSSIMPHGRDYQLKPETYALARKNHEEMIVQLAYLDSYVVGVAIELNNQMNP